MESRLLAVLQRRLEEGQSLASITVDSLVAEAGVSRANFYIHFQDKVDLLEGWLLETRQVLFEVSNAWYSAAASQLSQPRIHELLGEIFGVYRARMTLMRAMYETVLHDPTVREEFAEAFELHFVALTEHIRNGQRDGAIRPELDPRATAEWLICLVERVPMQIDRNAAPRELEGHTAAIAQIIYRTLYDLGNH
ncbi:TetR family transcriptional regulator [Mycobacterium sp. 20KCMC460]|nr:TetR family transcriptional regulator [Mycobacterium sp. 20KCMC460]GLD17406.1 TetR family transcriptional regulator [Mycobacterium kiyosense]